VLERRLGVHVGWIVRNGRRETVTMAVEARVKSLYDDLWNVLPESAGIEARWARSTREWAANSGFHGPLAWDDDTIDDPRTVPQTDVQEPVATEGGNVAARWLLGESVVPGAADRREVLAHLFEWTQLTKEQIAARLEMTPAAADQAWNRIKKQARQEGRRVPWRRTYALRDRDLTRTDMEEAA
jgi:hypothetical protein